MSIILFNHSRNKKNKIAIAQTHNSKKIIPNKIFNNKNKISKFSNINIWTKKESFICYLTAANHSAIYAL